MFHGNSWEWGLYHCVLYIYTYIHTYIHIYIYIYILARMRISENHVDIGNMSWEYHGITSSEEEIAMRGFQPGDFKEKKWRLPSGKLT